jgi:hypothetical protein
MKAKGELIIVLYCLIALSNFGCSWFWNDMTYALRVSLLIIPLVITVKRPNIYSLSLFILLVVSNIVGVLNDYKFIDVYDKSIATPKVIILFITLFISVAFVNKKD